MDYIKKKDIDTEESFNWETNHSILIDDFDSYTALLEYYQHFSLNDGVLTVLFVNDKKYMLHYLDVKNYPDDLLPRLCSVMHDCARRYYNLIKQGQLKYFEDNIDAILENYRLSDAQLTTILLSLANLASEHPIKKYTEKFINGYNFHFTCHDSEKYSIAEELINTSLDFFQYILENTDITTNIFDDIWMNAIEAADVDKVRYMVEKFDHLIPSEIDLSDFDLFIVTEYLDRYYRIFKILKDKGFKLVANSQILNIMHLAKVIHRFAMNR